MTHSRTNGVAAGWVVGQGVIGALAPLIVLGLLAVTVFEAADFVLNVPVSSLLAERWSPMEGAYGLLPLLSGTMMTTAIAVALAVVVGTPCAINLVCLSGPRERLLGYVVISVLAAMPSVIIGLISIVWLSPLLGFTVAAGSLSLAAMIAPTYALLLYSALRQLPSELSAAGVALGMSRMAVARRLLLPSIRRELIGIVALSTGRAMGEATAVSMVVGNTALSLLPGPFEAGRTLTTTILIEHQGAAGAHGSALFVAALVVATLIAATSLSAYWLTRR